MDHLEKLEKFLSIKHKKMKSMNQIRLLEDQKHKMVKEIHIKRLKGMTEVEMLKLNDQLEELEQKLQECQKEQDEEDQIVEEPKENKSIETDSDLSGKDDALNQTDRSAFDDLANKSMNLPNFKVTDRAADPEQQAKEDYMRRLMCFRKDELILPEESQDSDSDENEKA